MSHEELQIIKLCQLLYKLGYTSIHFEKTSDHFQNIIVLRACLMHSYCNKNLLLEKPEIHKRLKSSIDSLNLRYFIKNPYDKIRYNII
jgi:hypothetical protein